MSNSKKLTRYLSFLLLILLLAIGFYIYRSSNPKLPLLEDVGTARLMTDGTPLKILAGETDRGLGAVFLFVDKDGHIVDSLSVENAGLEGPSYRIVKGHTHDWLVVTTIYISGTGIMEYKDNWYTVDGYYGEPESLLSYISSGSEHDGPDEATYREFTTEVDNNSYADDKALDVRYVIKNCETKAGCSTASKNLHYVWHDEIFDPSSLATISPGGFRIDLTKSDVTGKEVMSMWWPFTEEQL